MPDQIKIPGLGEVPKKTAIIAGAGAVGIIAIVAIRHRTSSAGSTTPGTASATAATDPNAIDPNTGVPYSQEGGADVSGYGSGYQIPYGAGGAGYGAGGSGFDAAGYPIGSEADLAWQNEQNGTGGTTTGTTTGITTNQDWINAAESGIVPGSQATIAEAMAKIFGGLAVTTAQKDLFLEAQGIIGEPPPQGYPQPIKLKDTSGHPAPGKHKTIEASGDQDLSQIAKANRTTGGVLVTMNPYLTRYYGSKKHIPKGYKIKVP
jgi:hypothetical protein